MDTVDITIVGAGVVGLAVAARLARSGRSVLVAEKNASFGQETSSRNSEVIHSGIYYPQGTLKARLCVRGNGLLFAYCRDAGIKALGTGKIVIASTPEETARLTELKTNGERNGVPGLTLIDRAGVKAREKDIDALAGLLVPSTGIFDSHTFMQHLLAAARENDTLVSFGSEVTAVHKIASGYRVCIGNDGYEFETKVLVNCAGLFSDRIAALCGIDVDAAGYRLHYCKGEYFRVHRPLGVRHLVYPVPEAQIHSLGIHLTPDLAGGTRFGPNAFYVDRIDYTIDESRREEFRRAVDRYLPGIQAGEFVPDTAGIRPKLQGPDDPFRDFVIVHETGRELRGLVNLIGIDSPGLTSSLAIAEYVEAIARTDGLI